MSEGKAPLHVMIPISWKEELERMAKAKNVSIADVARELIDQGLHGKAQAAPAQAVKCQDDAGQLMGQLYNINLELLSYYGQLYKATQQLYEAISLLNEAMRKHFEITLKLSALYRETATAGENKA